MKIILSAKKCGFMSLFIFISAFFTLNHSNSFEGWEEPWKLIYCDDKYDIFVDGTSYSAKGYRGSVSHVLIDRSSNDPVLIQADPVVFNIDCKKNEFIMSAQPKKDELQIASNLANIICDFCKAERLALYKERGVKSNDLEAIETFLYPVSHEIITEVLKYTIENMSETPLPKNEFLESIAAIEDDIFDIHKKRSAYKAKKDFPLSIILRSYPKYCGWRIGWVYFGPDEFEEKQSSRYIRIKEFEYKNGIADFWTLNILNKDNYAVMRQKINCEQRKLKLLDLQMKTGKLLEIHEVPSEYKNWNSPPPNSPQMFLLQELCTYDVITKNDFLDKIINGERTWLRVIKKENIKLNLVPKILFE